MAFAVSPRSDRASWGGGGGSSSRLAAASTGSASDTSSFADNDVDTNIGQDRDDLQWMEHLHEQQQQRQRRRRQRDLLPTTDLDSLLFASSTSAASTHGARSFFESEISQPASPVSVRATSTKVTAEAKDPQSMGQVQKLITLMSEPTARWDLSSQGPWHRAAQVSRSAAHLKPASAWPPPAASTSVHGVSMTEGRGASRSDSARNEKASTAGGVKNTNSVDVMFSLDFLARMGQSLSIKTKHAGDVSDLAHSALQCLSVGDILGFFLYLHPKCSGSRWRGVFDDLDDYFGTREECMMVHREFVDRLPVTGYEIVGFISDIPSSGPFDQESLYIMRRFIGEVKDVDVDLPGFSFDSKEVLRIRDGKIVEMLQEIKRSDVAKLRQAAAAYRASIKRQEKAAFNNLDNDGNGCLDLEELKHASDALGIQGSDLPKDPQQLMLQFDKNGDGVLDRVEFSALFRASRLSRAQQGGRCGGHHSAPTKRSFETDDVLVAGVNNWQAKRRFGDPHAVSLATDNAESASICPVVSRDAQIRGRSMSDSTKIRANAPGGLRKRLRTKLKTDCKNSRRSQVGSAWERKFQVLQKFIAARGHARVPQNLNSKEYPGLGVWVNNKRAAYRNEKLRAQGQQPKSTARISAAQIARLESVGFEWSRSISATAWERNFERLKAYKAEYGHARPPTALNTEKYPRLGKWVVNQRQAYRFEKMQREGTRKMRDRGS